MALLQRQPAGRHQHRAVRRRPDPGAAHQRLAAGSRGFIGFLKHEDRGLQPDSWQINAYYKLYYYFGPWWRDTLRTRFGLGGGISYASRVPFSEQRDQDLRGRDTSKLLLYLDPTIDINIGDLFKSRPLRETYVGIGASHRSGIFGSARLFNSVNGGSNYIYGFVETGF